MPPAGGCEGPGEGGRRPRIKGVSRRAALPARGPPSSRPCGGDTGPRPRTQGRLWDVASVRQRPGPPSGREDRALQRKAGHDPAGVTLPHGVGAARARTIGAMGCDRRRKPGPPAESGRAGPATEGRQRAGRGYSTPRHWGGKVRDRPDRNLLCHAGWLWPPPTCSHRPLILSSLSSHRPAVTTAATPAASRRLTRPCPSTRATMFSTRRRRWDGTRRGHPRHPPAS
jgi:hypothetical protein